MKDVLEKEMLRLKYSTRNLERFQKMLETEYRLIQVSESLQPILNRLVFVGGGVTELLITDSAGRRPRPTEDLDCIIEVATRTEYYEIENQLRLAGYRNDDGHPPVICRWKNGALTLDVMPTIENILGFSNRWYKNAVLNSVIHTLPNGTDVNIINSVFYIATKTEAFKSRGREDYRSSHDFEDIIALINGREEIIQEMQNSDSEVLHAMKTYWIPKMESDDFYPSVGEILDAYEDTERAPIVMARLTKMFG